MPRTTPIVIIFEQHSFSSGSETAGRLVQENWCAQLGFELPCDMSISSIKQHYQMKRTKAKFTDERAALAEFDSAISALTDKSTHLNIQRVLSVRNYFSAEARLKLLAITEEAAIEVRSLDLRLAEKESLYKAARLAGLEEVEGAKDVALKRDEHIVQSIYKLRDVPTVCILGIQHAHNILSKLKGKGINIIPCYVEDSWAPELLKLTLRDSYPPELRRADGLLEFTSVQSAMEKLRDQLLPHTVAVARPLETPTSLTSLLFSTTHLPFYSIRSERYVVSAITKLSTDEEKDKALSIVQTLGRGSFFMHEGKFHFGLAGINLPESTSSLQKKVYDTYCTPSK